MRLTTLSALTCLLICSVTHDSRAGSSQDKYPWGHQVIPLLLRLVPAGPMKGSGGAYSGAEWYSEETLPVYGGPRRLFKIPFCVYQNFNRHIYADAIWDVQRHREAESDFRWDIGDLRLGTTVNFISSPDISLRFGLKLPNAPNNFEKPLLPLNSGMSGAGTDMMDFFVSGLLSVPIGRIRLHGNYSFLLIGDPTSLSNQLDLHALAAGLEYAGRRLHLLAEWDGTFGPRDFDNYAVIDFSIVYYWSRIFLGLRQGFGLNQSEDDYHSGASLGFTW